MEMGERDAEARRHEVAAFIEEQEEGDDQPLPEGERIGWTGEGNGASFTG
jgi:hypothetical protein